MRRTASFRIPADHPALAGHFPGNPIVPGTLILEQVIAACPQPSRQVAFAKFQRPSRPGEEARIDYTGTAGEAIDFVCHQGDRLICSGRLSAGGG